MDWGKKAKTGKQDRKPDPGAKRRRTETKRIPSMTPGSLRSESAAAGDDVSRKEEVFYGFSDFRISISFSSSSISASISFVFSSASSMTSVASRRFSFAAFSFR